MAEVRAGDRVAEDLGEEASLRALEALLFLERPVRFRGELLFRDQLRQAAELDAQTTRAAVSSS